jgi:hypothetical protein
MAETAVGLFEHESNADLVLDGLRRNGFSSEAIRVVTMPMGMAVDSPTSTPGIDFAAALAKDLRSMGASEGECEYFVSSVQSGSTLIFVTGTLDEADQAASLMDAHGAAQIEEFAGVAPALPPVHVGEIGANVISIKEDRVRANASGARVFTW